MEKIVPIIIVVIIVLLVDFLFAIFSIGIETVLMFFFDAFNSRD